jgi:hypothetical protein
MKNGKPITISESLLTGTLSNLEQLGFNIEEVSKTQINEKMKDFVATQKKAQVSSARMYMQKIAEIKFAVILSRGWFKEFKSFDENTLEMTFGNNTLKVTFDYKEEQINL